MNKLQFNLLTNLDSDNDFISVNELTNKEDRTLLFGYFADRTTLHVFLKNGEIFRATYYMGLSPHVENLGCEVNVEESNIIPNKRLYPETCDLEFCSLLKRRGFPLCFTTFDETRTVQTFYGKIV